jgi:hypothetical protein
MSFIITGKGKLTRNPMTVDAVDRQFTKLCVMNDDAFYIELWFHAGGELGERVADTLTAGNEVSLKAEIHPKAGKLRYLRSPGKDVYLITEMEVDGKPFALNKPG